MNIVDQKISSSLRNEPIREEELKNIKKQVGEEFKIYPLISIDERRNDELF